MGQPNPVRVASEWLKDQPEIVAMCGTRAAPWLTGTYPAIRLIDVGPSERGPDEALYRVQVECWADDYDTAADLAGRVAETLESGSSRGGWHTSWCAGGAVSSGPFSSPDPESQRYRHQLDVQLWLYPR